MSEQNNPMVIEDDLTIYTASTIKDQLMEAVKANADLQLDLSHVGEFDSAGLQVLYLAKREVSKAGHKLRIIAHSAAVRELLDLYNLVAYFGDPVLIPAREQKS